MRLKGMCNFDLLQCMLELLLYRTLQPVLFCISALLATFPDALMPNTLLCQILNLDMKPFINFTGSL